MAAVVALDLSRGGLRGVQVDAPYTARPKLTRFAAVEVPEGTIFDGEIIDQRRGVAAIKQLWKAGGFTTKKVVFGLSNRKVVVREVTLPMLTGPRRKAGLRFVVEGQVPIDLDDAILDFLPLRDVHDKDGDEMRQEGLLVATVRSSLESTVNAIERSGRFVDAVDFAGFSLLRLLPGPLRGIQAIVNVGASCTTVVIAAAASPQFVRIVPSGGDDVTRSLERALGVSFVEAEQNKIARGLQGGATTTRDIEAETVLRENVANLIDSIRNTLNFWANAHPEHPVSSVVLTGGGSRLTGLAPVLTSALGVPTSHGDPFAGFTVSPKLRESGLDNWALELAAPLGVAVGAKTGAHIEDKTRTKAKAKTKTEAEAGKAAKGRRTAEVKAKGARK
ncbi:MULTISPECIES: type IV pilus assembly protein PilM [unclassified Microbacterium]|uniref:type IV pilus assembly protein PilM n=1 Tax=unclassified Microbacterium TaxID=2609290 RepID=UPI00214C28F8|nr:MULTISPECIES: type IV pilus assembly protein PilM [unclassified Microbacterium]MCR2785917.1 type IV pilus assembly protein PilM [Microbacterium sp. zg.B96]WIM17108.1 type IV pilus assembly protein PilM [Microbacterium sp. zg-B96]